MAASAFAMSVRKLRENRGLSLRELSQLADIDHAYIYRLETGAKESPSAEVLAKLSRALKATKRDADMLRYLAEHADVSIGLAEYALEDQSVTLDELKTAATVVYRGSTRRDYKSVIERVRRFVSEDGDG